MSAMRKTPAIVVFFLFFSGSATLLEVTGVTAAMGVSSPTGVTTSLAEAEAAMDGIRASGGLADTLFGSFTAAASVIEALGRGVFGGPLLLAAVGIPGYLITFLFAPAAIIVGLDIRHYLTGRGA